MGKISLGNQGHILPMAVALLGTHLQEKPNFMALGWMSRVNFNPPMLGVGVLRQHATHDALLENREFSVNFPSRTMVDITDYAGLFSGKRTDKSTLFEVFYGELKAAPMITQCPLTMECSLRQYMELPTNTWFIGEIKSVFCEESALTDGAPDITKVQPLLLTMPDNRYWSPGHFVAKAWNAGKKLRK